MFSIRGWLPVPFPDTILGADSRLRDPAVQAEVELRVALYGGQFERYGKITKWLPRRGSGKSARAMRTERAARAAEPADESERVLGGDD
jgi:hypothetical protein